MKKLMAAFTAAAALAAGTALAQTKAPAASAQAVYEPGKVTLTLSSHGCTKDGHLFTQKDTIEQPVRETLNNQVTPQELKKIEDAYAATLGAAENEYWGPQIGLLPSSIVEHGIKSFSSPTWALYDPYYPGDRQARADVVRQIPALQSRRESAAKAFEKAVTKILKGNIAGPRQNVGSMGGDYEVSPNRVPECPPKP
jgi:hypothetical protein